MLCAIYKSSKKRRRLPLHSEEGRFFSQVPDTLMQMFGKPIMVMVIKLDGRQLASVDVEKKYATRLKVKAFFLTTATTSQKKLT
ncbi:YcgL domain-containing protein [Vibrio sinaloensis]|nr:YcgL domain-containing protein [Vibrio sinaloensis]